MRIVLDKKVWSDLNLSVVSIVDLLAIYVQMPGRLPPGYAPQMYGHHAPPGMMPPGQYAPPGYGAPPPPHHMVRPHQMGDMVKMPNGPTPAEWAAAQSRKACITSFFVLH